MDILSDKEQLIAAMGDRWDDINNRLYEMESIPNARDLGGIVTADGKRIKRGRLFRSALLTYGSDSDIALLRDDLQIGCVIDLRTTYETSRVADREIEGATYINMPVMDWDNNLWFEMFKFPGSEAEQLRAFAKTDMAKRMTRHMYIGFVMDEYCQLQYAAFLQKLLEIDGGTNVLWHCSQGKDRTGLVAAFLLFALGCDRQAVVDDFAITNHYYRNVVDVAVSQLYAVGGTVDDASVVEALQGVRVDYFEAALDKLDEEYGSIDTFLRDILLITPANRQRLRELYLE